MSDKGGIWDISNCERLGKSEVELVNCIIDGCKKLIEVEKKLQSGESMERLVPQEEAKPAEVAKETKPGEAATEQKPPEAGSDELLKEEKPAEVQPDELAKE